MGSRLYLFGLKQPGNDLTDCTPYMSPRNCMLLGSLSDVCLYSGCMHEADLTKFPQCPAAAKFGLSLLEDPLLLLPAQYLILDDSWHELVFTEPQRARQEVIYNSMAMGLLSIFEYESYPESMGDKSIHRYLSSTVDRFIAASLAYDQEEVLATPEFKAIRQLMRIVRWASSAVYTVPFSVHPRTFLERLVLKPITELVDELLTAVPQVCRKRRQ